MDREGSPFSAQDISQEELEVFLQEADEQLQLLDEDFIALEKEGSNGEILQEIFRAAHTIKGSSAMLGYQRMSSVAHAMETLLDKLRNGSLSANVGVINVLLCGLDALKSLKRELVSGESCTIDLDSVVAELKKTAAGESIVAQVAGAGQTVSSGAELAEKLASARQKGQLIYRAEVEIDGETSWPAVRCFQVLNEVALVGELVNSVPTQQEVEAGQSGYSMQILLFSQQTAETVRAALAAVPEVASIKVSRCDEECGSTSMPFTAAGDRKSASPNLQSASKTVAQKSAQVSQTIRVDVKLLDRMMNLVGEMVIDRNRIGQISKVLAGRYVKDDMVRALAETSAHVVRVVNELQTSVLRTRMLPVGTLFNGFPRLVMDVAQKADKKVEFIIEGEETELDRTIIEQMRDPLIHLLRNAVDHGVESPERRLAAGKSEIGTVRLEAYQEQSHIVVVVEDDGAGIDLKRIGEIAVQKGIRTADEAMRMSD
ncbi:MAG: Hpt domain-containing protein, partial [Chloroflexi bacterium]|nr:Hpt domain-containing protein [Chloroflexota bacterium]